MKTMVTAVEEEEVEEELVVSGEKATMTRALTRLHGGIPRPRGARRYDADW